MTEEKKIRMGRVVIEAGYTVDLNNSELVELAKRVLYEDVMYVVQYGGLHNWIKVIEDPKASPEDIPSFLINNI